MTVEELINFLQTVPDKQATVLLENSDIPPDEDYSYVEFVEYCPESAISFPFVFFALGKAFTF